jgi:hypothetical protein
VNEEMDDMLLASTPENTTKSSKQATRLYQNWRQWKITSYPSRPPPPKLDSADYYKLPGAIAQFFCEVRRLDNEKLRSDSVRVYFASIAWVIKEIDNSDVV